jgi:SAM-dependent methyltransferase
MSQRPESRAALAEFYDERYAGSYMESHPRLDTKRVRDVLERVPLVPRTILDYGCGRGAWIPLLAEIFPEAAIVGLDISVHALERARVAFPEREFHLLEGNAAPLTSASFDLVFSYHVLEHVYDLEATVADMARLVRPGGSLVVMLPCANERSLEERIVRLIEGGVEPSHDGFSRFFFDDPGHFRRPTSAQLVRLFAEHQVATEEELFAGQLWGAVEWLTEAGPDAIRELCDPALARSPSARALLSALRSVLLGLSFFTRIATTKGVMRRAWADTTPAAQRVQLAAAAPMKPLAVPIAWGLRKVAWREWRRNQRDANGSAMYLLLRKE